MPTIATFNGQSIFGVVFSMATQDNPRAEQRNAFPGVSGVESLDLGRRGRVTTVSGRLGDSTRAGLATAEALFRSYNDGLAYSLYDNGGVLWANVKLDRFAPEGRVQVGLFGGPLYSRKYEATFFHL